MEITINFKNGSSVTITEADEVVRGSRYPRRNEKLMQMLGVQAIDNNGDNVYFDDVLESLRDAVSRANPIQSEYVQQKLRIRFIK